MEQQMQNIMPDNYTPELWNTTTTTTNVNDFKPTTTHQNNNKNGYTTNTYATDFWNASSDAYKQPQTNTTTADNVYYWGNKNPNEVPSDRQYNSDTKKSTADGYYGTQDSNGNRQGNKRGNEDENESEDELVDQVIETSNGNVFNLSSQQNHPAMKYEF